MNNILVTRSSMTCYEEYCEEIKELWDSRWQINMGVNQVKRETLLIETHVVLYTNGHPALKNAIAAMNLPKGGEFITTPVTFASITHAIVRNGLNLVFCDINDVSETPFALHISKRVLTLPLYEKLSIDDVDQICEVILGII